MRAVQTSNDTTTGMKPSLGLTGVTINAMALIAPGAFLWTTYQAQSSPGSAMSMWFAVFVATAIALLTATVYSALAKRYPEAGTGSSYYFAEASLLHKEEHRHFKFARLSKFVVGWASHFILLDLSRRYGGLYGPGDYIHHSDFCSKLWRPMARGYRLCGVCLHRRDDCLRGSNRIYACKHYYQCHSNPRIGNFLNPRNCL